MAPAADRRTAALSLASLAPVSFGRFRNLVPAARAATPGAQHALPGPSLRGVPRFEMARDIRVTGSLTSKAEIARRMLTNKRQTSRRRRPHSGRFFDSCWAIALGVGRIDNTTCGTHSRNPIDLRAPDSNISEYAIVHRLQLGNRASFGFPNPGSLQATAHEAADEDRYFRSPLWLRRGMLWYANSDGHCFFPIMTRAAI